MGTYAIYRIWAGICEDEFPEVRGNFIEQALESWGGVMRGSLHFSGINMHGKTIGMGVVIKELNWVPSIGKGNEFDTLIGLNAEGILLQVLNIFYREGIKVKPKLYHHIDLGG